MKENLKIRVNDNNRQEIIDLLGKLGKSFCWDVKTRWSEIAAIFAYKKQNLEWDSDLGYNYFKGHSNKEITLTELRELARTKEYLNDKFELVVTNQPDDGFILVPDGADKYTHGRKYGLTIWEYSFWIDDVQSESNGSSTPNGSMYSDYVSSGLLHKILWQRENKVETSKGRFLHQWAYEAFGRGEALEYSYPLNGMWVELSDSKHTLSIFNGKEVTFRLKPQTIQIGSRTIVKPISVKPEKNMAVFVSNPCSIEKYHSFGWVDTEHNRHVLNSNLCHLTESDAIAMTDAILELMK